MWTSCSTTACHSTAKPSAPGWSAARARSRSMLRDTTAAARSWRVGKCR
ncbi:hypothetical protein [Ornithinimicrobium kibberense]